MPSPVSKIACAAPFAALLLGAPSLMAQAPPAPSEVVAYAPNQHRVHLAWKDNADDETRYWVDRWNPATSTWIELGDLPPNAEVFRAAAPSTAEQTVRYRVAAFRTGLSAGALNWVEAEVLKPQGDLDLLFSQTREIPEGYEGRANFPFAAQIEVHNGSPDRFLAREHPAWLALDEASGVLSGTPPAPGVYRFFVGVAFDDEGEERFFEQVRFLRVLPAPSIPEVANPGFTLPPQGTGVSGFVDLTGLFHDPARPKGAWFNTASGSFVVALYDSATPKSVDNFLGYVARRDYDNTWLHRSDPGFVVQGGGFGPLSTTSTATQWRGVPKQANLPNEPGISNRRGTISMAKAGGNPDSAGSEWFISTGAGNPGILDAQNGGFTAFGEVVGAPGMAVADALNSLSRLPSLNVTVGGTPRTFYDVPLTPGGNLVEIFSLREVPPVAIRLLSNDQPGVLSASMAGMYLFLTSSGAPGTVNLLLEGRNLDGNTVTFPLAVTIVDRTNPEVRLRGLKGGKKFGVVQVRGSATDNGALASWRYQVNRRGAWRNGGHLVGTSATFSRNIRGFKRGRNFIGLRVFDAAGNQAQMQQRFILR